MPSSQAMHATLRRYNGYLGRDPEAVWCVTPDEPPCLAVFPVMEKAGFFRRLFSTAGDQRIYLTAGIATTTKHPVEFVGCRHVDAPHETEESVLRDCEAAVMMRVLEFAMATEDEIDLGHTLDFGEPLAPGSDLTSVLFLPVPDELGERDLLRRAKPAERLLSVMPISAYELELKKREGLEALIDLFEQAGVAPALELSRKSVEKI